MKIPARSVAVMVLLLVSTGIVGGWVGVQYGLSRTQPTDLHLQLHRDLSLTPEQELQIHGFETKFAAERDRLEAEMRAANAELAASIKAHSPDSDRTRAAVQRFHVAMGALQTETINHVLAMRAVLTPEQALTFDEIVSRALTSERP